MHRLPLIVEMTGVPSLDAASCRAGTLPRLLESGTAIRIVQAFLGHRNLNPTARYPQVATSTIRGTPSPLDHLRLEVPPPS